MDAVQESLEYGKKSLRTFFPYGVKSLATFDALGLSLPYVSETLHHQRFTGFAVIGRNLDLYLGDELLVLLHGEKGLAEHPNGGTGKATPSPLLAASKLLMKIVHSAWNSLDCLLMWM